MSKNSLLEINDLHVNVEDKEILHGVNLSVGTDEVHVLMGPNGTGKSTLGYAITGHPRYTVTSGKILFDGEDITELSITDRARKGISFAFQQPVRFKGITVKDLITLAAGEPINAGKACEYLSEVGLCAREYINREVNASLSGGELKRIEIAMILARGTSVSIFDEPEAGIDLWSFNNLIDVFEKMHEETKGSIIIISHQERILNIADRIIVIADGKVAASGGHEMLPTLLGSGNAKESCKKMEAR